MVAPGGPTCPHCGSALRWVPEWNAWGCDRCRVTFPAQGQPQAQAPAPVARAGGRGKTIAIVAGVAGVAVVGIVLAVTLGGGKGGGKGSPEELAKAAFERAQQGDVDGLVALTGTPGLVDRVMDCPGDKAAKMNAEMDKLAHENMGEHLADWKGVTATLVSLEAKGDPDRMAAGKEEEGCKVKVDVSTQRFRAKVKAKGPDGTEGDGEVPLTAMQIDGRWYLEDLGGPPSVGDVAKLVKMKDAMCACKDAACVDKVQKDYADFMQAMQAKFKGDAKPDEEMMKVGMEMAECMDKAQSGGSGSP